MAILGDSSQTALQHIKALWLAMLSRLLAVAAMMRMQPLSLFIFATVFLSCAFSQDAGNDELNGLLGPKIGEKYLEKKKPPPNVPGPKLTLRDLHFSPLLGIREHGEITEKLMPYNPDKGRKIQAELTKNKENFPLGPQEPKNKDRFISDREKKNQRRGANLD